MVAESTGLVLKVLQSSVCRSTHHKLALDALPLLRMADAESWIHLFLHHVDAYLEGSKAPDDAFKDFKNHVLHVRQNGWGGALQACRKWYDSTVAAMRERNWEDAAYHAGVLSHYVTDPVMPFHTGQTEEENTIHRALEWSVTKSYDDLRGSLAEVPVDYPEVHVPSGSDWLEELVQNNAAIANADYETLLEHYDFQRGVQDPPAGLDEHLRSVFSHLLGLACVAFARVLERAIDEAQQPPEPHHVTLVDVLAERSLPIQMVLKRLVDHQERAVVAATFDELRQTGRVIRSLPEELRTIRSLHAQEVLKVPESELTRRPLRPTGTRHGASDPVPVSSRPDPALEASRSKVREAATHSQLRFYLAGEQPVVDAPTIGPKTASRLNDAGIETVRDLLYADPHELASKLRRATGNGRSADADTIRDWQAQAILACRIPNLRGHDAQILVACGIKDPEQLARAELDRLWREVAAFLSQPAAQRILRDGTPPDTAEVRDWIHWANQSRPLAAA